MAHTTLSDIILVFHAQGPGIALDRELLDAMMHGAIGALTPEMLEKRGIQHLKAKSYGFNPLDTAEAEQARIAKVQNAMDSPPPPSVAKPSASSPKKRPKQ